MDASTSGDPSERREDSTADGDEFAPPAPVTDKARKKSNKRGALGGGGGPDDDDDDANKKKRNRKPVTCAQCRRRKLKCDRGYPCGACRDRQEGHLCEWEGAIRLPQPHLTRDAEAQELRGQLDRFENLLNTLNAGNLPGGTAAPSASATVSTQGAGVVAGLSSAHAPESAVTSALKQTSQANGTSAKVANTNARAQLFAHAQSVGHLIGLLPSRKELDILVARFLASEPNFLPVVHVPSFEKRYHDFSHSSASEDPFLLAFLFAIVSYEMGWQLTDPDLSKTAGFQKEGAMKRLYEAASEALRMSGFMESPNLDVVRTLVVLYHSAHQQLDARANYVLTQAIQVAQTLGLNRDPRSVGITDVIESEERRRLWYILVALDSLEEPGRLSIISPEQFDTEVPASAFDHEITDAGITSRPFPTFTPALYLELIRRLGDYNGLLSNSFFSIKPKEAITWSKVQASNAGLDRLKASFPPLSWKAGLVEPLPEDSFASDRFRVLAHTALLKLDVRVNRPFLTRGCVDPRFREGRNRVLDAAHQLLGIWLAYPDHSQVSRLWQLAYHGLNAVCIIAVDLYQDPTGSRSDAHRKFLAMSSGRLDRPEFKSRVSQEVVRVVNVLTKNLATASPAQTRSTGALDPEEKFVVSSLPVPLTMDPFAYHPLASSSPSLSSTAADRDPELATLWHEMVASYPSMYGVPDKKEWDELSKRDVEARWTDGIDLVANGAGNDDEAVDQLEEED
ncbi:hypothetical protein JCM11491_004325 [Sporobolomyces phaffii]